MQVHQDITILSPDKSSIVKIEKGELISYKINNEELIHQKGDPGWDRSDIEMFPVIGPTSKNKYTILTKVGKGIQDQHGFLKDINYVVTFQSENKVILQKTYIAQTKVKNSLFPKNSTQKDLNWPFSFTFQKTFTLINDELKISFLLESDKGMPFMLGYHPAFKLSGEKTEICLVNDQKISIQEVIDKGGPSYPFKKLSQITLIKESGYNIRITEKGFNNMMLWTAYPNMICIEPITQYPDLDKQNYSENNLRLSLGKDEFSVRISPFKK